MEKVTPTRLKDVLVIEPRVFGDERGFFMETWQARRYAEAGVQGPFVQDNHSGSRRGALRGLHYQIGRAQGKLLRVVAGEVFDVAVDLRRSSPTFRDWVGLRLSAENRLQLWVPPGFAHGFYVTSDWAEVIYKTTDFYDAASERTLAWNDPDVAVEWPLGVDERPTLSTKDAAGLHLSDLELFD
jgi:dTDP-4-dehydrorhamnose 3,5-epimerase